MSLFRPSHFPLSHHGSITRIPMAEFDEIKLGIYRRKGSEEHLNFRDSLKTSMLHSLDALLASYSSWTYCCQTSLSVGNIKRIEVPLPNGYEIYSAPIPTAVMGNPDKGEHCFPSLFSTDGNSVLIGTTSHQVANSNIGSELGLMFTAYCYFSTGAPDWKKLLYSGLSNLSKGNTNVSVLLLTTAIELYETDLFSKYLEMKGIEEPVRIEIIKSGRTWPLKAKRIKTVLESTLPIHSSKTIAAALKDFKENVKDPRNKYAHEHSEDITKTDAHNAYCATFDLLWLFDSLDTALNGDLSDCHT